MRINKIFISFGFLVACSFPVFAQVTPALQTVSASELTVNFTGDFPKRSCSGDAPLPCFTGTRLDANNSGGLLVTYRHHFTSWSAIEVNYDYTRFLESYNSGSAVRTRVDEVSLGYVVTLGTLTGEHFLPFAEIGLGALIFSPTSSTTTGDVTQDHAPLLYGGGFDLTDGGHLAVRFGYRGLVFQAPDFGISGLGTGVTHIAEPYVGIVVRF